MSIVVTATFFPAEGAREALLEAMRIVIPLVHDEDGCELYAIQEDDEGTIVMIEKWESAQSLDAHGAGEAVADFTRRLDGLLAVPVEVVRYGAIPIGDPAKGAL